MAQGWRTVGYTILSPFLSRESLALQERRKRIQSHGQGRCFLGLIRLYSRSMTTDTKHPELYIIDGNSYIYRAFYAIKSLSTSTGLPTNAAFGFVNMLLKVIKEKAPDMV